MEEKQCSKNTVRNYIAKFNMVTPKGFFKRQGSITGRPPGFKHTEEFKEMMRVKFTGKNNPFYGKQHTEETKMKMSQNHADFSGEKNPFRNKYKADEQFRQDFRNKHLELWKNRDELWRQSFREKLSKSMAESSTRTNSNHKNYNHGIHYSSKMPEGFYCRSSWEVMVAEQLDASSLVQQYEYESIVIPYYDEKESIWRHNIIDFMVNLSNNQNIIIEVKPKTLLNYASLKILAQECYCLENQLQYLIAFEDIVFNDKLMNGFLTMAYNGELYVDKFIRQGFEGTAQFVEKTISGWRNHETNRDGK